MHAHRVIVLELIVCIAIIYFSGEQIESDFCGYTLPDPITVYGSQHVTVEFSSDSSVQDQGFAIEVAFGSMSRSKCFYTFKIMFVLSKNQIKSSLYPRYYAAACDELRGRCCRAAA